MAIIRCLSSESPTLKDDPMTTFKLVYASAGALGLGLVLATNAFAAPKNAYAFNPFIHTPDAASPVAKAPQAMPSAAPSHRAGCDCMAMMVDRSGGAATTDSAG